MIVMEKEKRYANIRPRGGGPLLWSRTILTSSGVKYSPSPVPYFTYTSSEESSFWQQLSPLITITLLAVISRIAGAKKGTKTGRRQQDVSNYNSSSTPSLLPRMTLSVFGPTTLHLQYESTLLICNLLLTCAAMASFYRGAFGSWGDAKYLAVTGLWLSRHLVLRWLCTNDTSTSCHPTTLGTAAKVLSKCVSGGQYFDCPPPSVLWDQPGSEFSILVCSWVTRIKVALIGPLHILSSLWNKTLGPVAPTWFQSVGTSSSQGTGVQGDDDSISTAKSGGGGRRRGGSRNGSGSTGSSLYGSTASFADHRNPSFSSEPLAALRKALRDLYQKSANILEKAGFSGFPSAQKLVFFGTIAGLICVLLHNDSAKRALEAGAGPKAGFPGAGGTFHSDGSTGQNIHVNLQKNNANEVSDLGLLGSMFGSHVGRHRSGGPFFKESRNFFSILILIAWIPTTVTLFMFGRALFPIPDLATGSSAQKTLRVETRYHGGGGGKYSSKAKSIDALPWSEQYHSINSQNRFRLHCRIIFLRVIESIFLCVVIPQTEQGCVGIGHCNPNPYLWDLPGYSGVATSHHKGRGFMRSQYDDTVHDRFLCVLLAFTVSMVTASLLLSQAAILDRSFLAVMGRVGVDVSTRVEKGGRSGGRQKDRRLGTTDSLRSSDRKADVYYKLIWKVFQNETGNPSTSRVIAGNCCGLVTVLALQFSVFIVYFYKRWEILSSLFAIVAVWKATLAVLSIGTLDRSKLGGLAREIMVPLEAHNDDEPISTEEASGITMLST